MPVKLTSETTEDDALEKHELPVEKLVKAETIKSMSISYAAASENLLLRWKDPLCTSSNAQGRVSDTLVVLSRQKVVDVLKPTGTCREHTL